MLSLSFCSSKFNPSTSPYEDQLGLLLSARKSLKDILLLRANARSSVAALPSVLSRSCCSCSRSFGDASSYLFATDSSVFHHASFALPDCIMFCHCPSIDSGSRSKPCPSNVICPRFSEKVATSVFTAFSSIPAALAADLLRIASVTPKPA